MKQHIRPDIDYKKCNAYSGTSFLYAAIRVENRPVFATNINDEKAREVPDGMKGGIIVFPRDADVALCNIEEFAQRLDPAGWTIGKFFKGRYTAKNGKVYSEDSLSVEIFGLSDDALVETGEEYCSAFNQESVLIKANSERNQILLVSGINKI